jgi:hypothetical protein
VSAWKWMLQIMYRDGDNLSREVFIEPDVLLLDIESRYCDDSEHRQQCETFEPRCRQCLHLEICTSTYHADFPLFVRKAM